MKVNLKVVSVAVRISPPRELLGCVFIYNVSYLLRNLMVLAKIGFPTFLLELSFFVVVSLLAPV